MRIIYLLIFLLCSAAAINAQQKRDTIRPSDNTTRKVKMKEQLGLNKQQSKEFKADNKEFKQKASTVKADTTLSKKQRKNELRKLKKEKQTKENAILTPAQQQKAKELKKEKKAEKKVSQTNQ